ncbi:MAG: GAF domain-containing protein [Betaproteobacteria bacterium]|nr:GAF domain-containing protein [Betaproteobacteria bacterium]
METSSNLLTGPTLMSSEDLQQGIASLSRGAYFGEASLDMMLSILTESAATICGVERASIWALTDDQRELRCLELFEYSTRQHSSGNTLDAIGHPVYFAALRAGSSLVVDDVYVHPLTVEFVSYYLPRHRITAMLAMPIHIRGELQGVLCLEQVGSRQAWASAHQIFAQAVANLVALALVEYEAGEAKRQAQVAKEQLRAVINASQDAMLLADGNSGEILDVNYQAEALTGRSREELLGRHHGSLYPVEQQKAVAGEVLRMLEGRAGSLLAAEVLRSDGRKIPVSVMAKGAVLSDGRRLALSVLRAA